MDKLTNKRYETYDYTSRYTPVPYFFDTKAKKDIYGIGEQMNTDSAFYSHKIAPGDTLDSLALTFYNNPTYWWVIAYFNLINDPFIDLQK